MSIVIGDTAYSIKARSTANDLVADLVTEVRDNVSEFTEEYFTDARILRWLNRAHQSVYNELGTLGKKFFVTTTTLNLVKDQTEYTLPSDFKKVIYIARIKDAGGTLLDKPISIDKISLLDKDAYLYRRLERWNPGYCYISGSKIGFSPIPSVNETGTIQLLYLPLPTKLTTGGTFQIPSEHGNLLVLYASYMALRSEKESGEMFLRDYQQELLRMKHDLATRNQSWPDNLRSTDWNNF